MDDEVRSARNKRRALKRQADMLLIESELRLAEHLHALLKETPGTLSVQQQELLPILIDSLGTLKDQRLAALWSSKLGSQIAANPRWLDGAPGKALHKVAGLAARAKRAGGDDRRTQSERKKQEAARAEWERGQGLRVPLPGSSPSTPEPSPKKGDATLDDLLRDVDLPPQ